MVSAVFILHWPDSETLYLRCELLLHRSYYNNLADPHLVVQRFHHVYTQLQPHERTPFLFDHGMTYIFLWVENDIILMAAARSNVNALLTVTFLHDLHDILIRYFEVPNKKQDAEGHNTLYKESHPGLTRERIIDNHSLVFELLDECIDFGIVQLTEYNILKEYIKTEINRPSAEAASESDDSDSDSSLEDEYRVKRMSAKTDNKKSRKKEAKKSTHNLADKTDVLNDIHANMINSSIVRTQALAVHWRPKGIFYAKNEIYIDIVEKCNFFYDFDTETVKKNDIFGVCDVKSYLSGMPVCKLGLNERYISQVEYDAELDGDLDEEEEEVPQEQGDNLIKQPDSETSSLASPPPEQASQKRLKVPISHVAFHQCTELSSVYKNNLIRFTPPDDEFTLFSYNVAQLRRKERKPILMIEPVYKIYRSQGKLQINCTVRTALKKRLHLKPLVIRIPISPALFRLDGGREDSLRFKAELGLALFEVDSSTLTWIIPDVPGSKPVIRLMAELAIANAHEIDQNAIQASFYQIPKETQETGTEESTADELSMYYGVNGKSSSVFDKLQRNAAASSEHRQINVEFSIPLLTYSGLRITYLSVQEETLKYTCFPWVRYLTEVRSSNPHTLRGVQPSEYSFRLAPKCFQVIS